MKLYCSSHEDIIQRVGTYLVLTMVVIKLVQTTDKNKINYANKTVLRASLCKILISSFAHKMDFAHNFSVDFF